MGNKFYIVTGGGGFVGRALCLRLVKLGHRVMSLSRGDYPELRKLGIETIKADIASDPKSYSSSFKGADGVFHVASKVDFWGNYQDFYESNVRGTQNVLSACLQSGVNKLVYTSSPSVIADGKDLRNVDEEYPIPTHHDAFYPATKAIAEKEVLRVNGMKGLLTLALRPHIIWGPGDRHIIPKIIQRAKQGRLFKIGTGNNIVDVTFIDDCVEAHVVAMEKLSNDPSVAGKAYFISQNQPVRLWDWINQIVMMAGLPPVNRRVPLWIATALSTILELASKLNPYNTEPLFTKFMVLELAKDHYFNISRAIKDLGYKPRHTMQEAMEITKKWLCEQGIVERA